MLINLLFHQLFPSKCDARCDVRRFHSYIQMAAPSKRLYLGGLPPDCQRQDLYVYPRYFFRHLIPQKRGFLCTTSFGRYSYHFCEQAWRAGSTVTDASQHKGFGFVEFETINVRCLPITLRHSNNLPGRRRCPLSVGSEMVFKFSI